MSISVPAEALFGALPVGWLTAADMPTVIERMTQDPAFAAHLLQPVDTKTAAEICGFPSAGALRQSRHRGHHPETWDADRNLYTGGRLACLRWMYRNSQQERL